MYITYIYHSGFLFEFDSFYILIDFYKGILPILNKEKKLYVFASHFHSDHYNPYIFEILKNQKFPLNNILAILSKDIYYKKIPEEISYIYIKPNQTTALDYNINVTALKSTDSGVAFLITTASVSIFHAGDLNDWVWDGEAKEKNHNMTANFKREINKLKNMAIDIVCFPLDPHLGKNYANGLLYVLNTFHAQWVFPMHYWEQKDIIEKFKKEYPVYATKICNTEDTQNTFYKNSI